MSKLTEKVFDLEMALVATLSRVDFSDMTDQEIKQLLRVNDWLDRGKDFIERTLAEHYKKQTSEIADIPLEVLATAKEPRKQGRAIPDVFTTYNAAQDVLLNEKTVCHALKIKSPTLTAWRRNWYRPEGTGFPPPVIYVYGSPRWTKRLVEWWLNDSGEKAFIKGRDDGKNQS